MKLLRTRFTVISLGVLALFITTTQFALAAGRGVDTLGNYLLQIVTLIDVYLVPIIFALAFLVFIWGIFQYFIVGATNEVKRDSGKQLMIWGLLGFFVMISIWGIINLLLFSFSPGNNSRPPYPIFGTPNNSGGAPGSGGGNGNVLDTLTPDTTTSTQPDGNKCTDSSQCGGEPCVGGTCDFSAFGPAPVPQTSPTTQTSGGTSNTNNKCDGVTCFVPGQVCSQLDGRCAFQRSL